MPPRCIWWEESQLYCVSKNNLVALHPLQAFHNLSTPACYTKLRGAHCNLFSGTTLCTSEVYLVFDQAPKTGKIFESLGPLGYTSASCCFLLLDKEHIHSSKHEQKNHWRPTVIWTDTYTHVPSLSALKARSKNNLWLIFDTDTLAILSHLTHGLVPPGPAHP